jgi:methionine synthase / methylenetetrahydrofolate reductase (NADH)
MKVTDKVRESGGVPVFICDFSPPRGADPEGIAPAKELEADYICVAYNPGKAVRVDSAAMASAIKRAVGREVVFNLATRDMNKLALQSHLLGAQMSGLENLVVLAGDAFSERDRSQATEVADFRPTELIASIAAMNAGTDYKGSRLWYPTDFCIGASIDLTRGVAREARLAHRKAQAGAHFFLTQPIFNPAEIGEFQQAYAAITGTEMARPIFWGVQILEKDGVIFSSVPPEVRCELEAGRPGTDIALALLRQVFDAGVRTIYLVPPILRGGARKYDAAQTVLAEARRG